MKVNLPITDQETLVPTDQFIYSTTDLKGRITSVNDEFAQISGFSREELVGQNHNLVRHPDMRFTRPSGRGAIGPSVWTCRCRRRRARPASGRPRRSADASDCPR